ncbi:MAG TPA: fatty acid desaturase family protein, partial [Myxococcota bacterium]|nr:fatty acid desaturase family protein [Myxococcota bacterium]
MMAASNEIVDEYSSAGELLRDAFSREELARLKRVSNVRSAFAIAANFAFIAGWMALAAIWPNPLTIVLALFGIGARQLGFAVLFHDASHRVLFTSRQWNDALGNWLTAYPVWSEIEPYRRYHLVHHAHTGTERDPDLGLARPFPITRRSLRRKLWRDLSGQTGWKQAVATAKRDLGVGKKRTQRTMGLKAGERPDVGWHKLAPFALWNLAILATCAAAGHAWVYLLYPIAFLTTYRLALRIRAIAEHAMSGPLDDPLQNTRTTLPRFWERVFLAPFGINYHLEH